MLIHLIQILIFSSFIFLSFLMMSNPLKVNKKANKWFGVFLFLWASFWVDEILILTKANPLSEISTLLISFFQFFTPIILYLSIVFFTNPNYKFRIKDFLFLVLPIAYLILLIISIITPVNIDSILVFTLILHALIFTTLSYLKIRKHQHQINLFSSNTIEIDLKWLEYIVLGIIFIAISITVFNFVYFGLPLNLYINIIMLGGAFFVAYHALRQKEIFPLNEKHREEIIALEDDERLVDIPKRKIIKDEDLVVLKTKLNVLIKNKELYLNHEINLASLSEEMNITSHQLSYIINNGFNQNFFQFINEYRVEKAKTLLMDKSSDNLSILGIAYESGFSSKTAFNTTFKKFTNQTPSEFKKHSSGL
ncbi:helix-turn-helix domain-containing protein [Urechidicola vernalis]|uniref:Helix-turn-helix domain-containing protein n=1 Tax=Urechidicola vernalis TaxID=3075600 RepID=A0ABU2Y1U6_9FLAO|nr:helix-turn-helix domain-containing protein [Urechidicola sp. P050]MDT0551997.1 helix-turn-helix domain-containing protein [Urechidicola sp. P050]